MTAMFQNCCPKISVTFKSNLTIVQKYSGIYEFSGQSTVLGEHVHVVLPIVINTEKLPFSRKISNLSRGKRKKYVYFS